MGVISCSVFRLYSITLEICIYDCRSTIIVVESENNTDLNCCSWVTFLCVCKECWAWNREHRLSVSSLEKLSIDSLEMSEVNSAVTGYGLCRVFYQSMQKCERFVLCFSTILLIHGFREFMSEFFSFNYFWGIICNKHVICSTWIYFHYYVGDSWFEIFHILIVFVCIFFKSYRVFYYY